MTIDIWRVRTEKHKKLYTVKKSSFGKNIEFFQTTKNKIFISFRTSKKKNNLYICIGKKIMIETI